jgi:UDP:flavonoid glycosyltransferase YjiC (YdhE family)
MSVRVLYAWELGANLGHVAAFLPLAQALRDDGHEIACALRETRTGAQVLSGQRIPWLQAPFLAETPSTQPPLSYTDIMLRFGFGDRSTLTGYIGAWLSIIQLYRPRVIVADHAPAALLAARIARLPAVMFGTGFCCPPPLAPLPSMRPWEPAPSEALSAIDARIGTTINEVCATFGAPALTHPGQLFDCAETAVLGFPELDHYAGRSRASYWGAIGSAGIGEAPSWPEAPGRRIFAYLRPGHAQLNATLQALIDLQQPTLLFCPGLPAANVEALRTHRHLRLSAGPVDIAQAVDLADAALTHGSFATTVAFLQAGKPVLVLPNHLEQFLMGYRLEQAGIGLLIQPNAQLDASRGDILRRLHAVITDPVLRANAAAFANRYREFPQTSVIANLARRIVELGSIT